MFLSHPSSFDLEVMIKLLHNFLAPTGLLRQHGSYDVDEYFTLSLNKSLEALRGSGLSISFEINQEPQTMNW